MDARPATASRPTAALSAEPSGTFVTLDGRPAYRIGGYHRLEPFLISLASDTDLWLFAASSGGLTAGRVDAGGALFPYVTSDLLADAHHHTGPLTLVRVEKERPASWAPLAGEASSSCERNLYKNVTGTQLTFEEIDHDLGLALRYRWAGCDAFGWVRTVWLENLGSSPLRLAVLDGLRNVQPWGAPLALHQQASNLVDAYRLNEVDAATGLGTYSLTAGITDRAEALEVLRATTVWCSGLAGAVRHVSPAVVEAFRRGRVLAGSTVQRGRRGHYLVSAQLDLEPGETVRWHLAADAGRDHRQVAELHARLRDDADLDRQIEAALRDADEGVRRLVATADGLQRSGRPESSSHHFANVLFNIMRGGVFAGGHDVPRDDLAAFIATRNRDARARHDAWLAALPPLLPATDLRAAARATGDADLVRLAHEYLPLFFGRRHGDPSRPWNRFEIRVRTPEGGRALHYEGNWRDIFQNWEALGLSFPAFLTHLVAKFVNATTVDGFNPYRLTRDGIDWEAPSPDDPWSNIGYWGDHQIVYLTRLLEALRAHEPAVLAALLGEEIFSYADVPYRLRPYAQIVRDPRTTIDYDRAHAARIDARVARHGSDGRLLATADGAVHHANLLEKLLVPVLAKLSNLVPDAGIWMNTQRPEWNDANNALAGGGVSVVTLAYLRRHLALLADLLANAEPRELPVASEVAAWFERVDATLTTARPLLADAALTPGDRRRILDALGAAFDDYRAAVYAGGFTGRRVLATTRVLAALRTALAWVDHGLAANRRDDGLWHTYNLLEFADDAVAIGRLPLMLEGQVAAISSGILAPAQVVAVLEGLFASDLYQPEQRSFLLYPARDVAGFRERNAVPAAAAAAIPLLDALMAAGETSLVTRDDEGVVRFQGDLRQERNVVATLATLGGNPRWSAAVARDRDAVLALYEAVFRHRSYLGRSQVMYGYEGIGCIYWHMVAKLLLATQESYLAAAAGPDTAVADRLAALYFRIRAGLGYEKSVAEYGAFPTDPYSHTPPDGGAKQPGMTGQVKEEILTRRGELGVRIAAATLSFAPALLRAGEFLTDADDFICIDAQGRERNVRVPAGGLAFTICQVPVVYVPDAAAAWHRVTLADGTVLERPGTTLDPALSAEILERRGNVQLIEIGFVRHAA